jgi:hypothetical protein
MINKKYYHKRQVIRPVIKIEKTDNKSLLQNLGIISSIIIAIVSVGMAFHAVVQTNKQTSLQSEYFEIEHRPYLSVFLNPTHNEKILNDSIKLNFSVYNIRLKNSGIFPADIKSIQYIYKYPNGKIDTTLREYNNGIIIPHNSDTAIGTKGLSENDNGTDIKITIKYTSPIYQIRGEPYVCGLEFIHKYGDKDYKIISSEIK